MGFPLFYSCTITPSSQSSVLAVLYVPWSGSLHENSLLPANKQRSCTILQNHRRTVTSLCCQTSMRSGLYVQRLTYAYTEIRSKTVQRTSWRSALKITTLCLLLTGTPGLPTDADIPCLQNRHKIISKTTLAPLQTVWCHFDDFVAQFYGLAWKSEQ